jgi:hypothetical protein
MEYMRVLYQFWPLEGGGHGLYQGIVSILALIIKAKTESHEVM